MATASINPLQSQDLSLAQSIVDTGNTLLAYYAKCDNCGLNTAVLKQQVQAYIDFANGVIAQFGPGQNGNQ